MHKTNFSFLFGGAVAEDREVVADDDFVRKDKPLGSLERCCTGEFEYDIGYPIEGGSGRR